jgi:hypothetical protein
MYPQAIADLKIRNVADGQFFVAAADAHFHTWAGKIERCRVGKDRAGQKQENDK